MCCCSSSLQLNLSTSNWLVFFYSFLSHRLGLYQKVHAQGHDRIPESRATPAPQPPQCWLPC